MYHHDSRSYEEAASEAAAKGRVRLEEVIQKGLANAESVVEAIQSRVISDKVTRAPAVRLEFDGEGTRRLVLGGRGDDFAGEIHDHAMGQLLENVGVPKRYADHLTNEAGGDLWGKMLLAENVNQILSYRQKQRNLVRIEGNAGGGTAKGFLSDKFRRLDSRPLCDAFIGACKTFGMVPIDGVASDTKCRLRAVLPKVFEPIPNEVMVFGAEFGNSDYGDGGLVVNLWTMRVWCTNLAVTEKCLRQVHLGGRLPDDVRFSDETYRKDAETTALAVRDTVGNTIGPERVHRMLEAIKTASESEIKSRDGIEKVLGKNALDKGELGQVENLYNGPDVVNMPPGDTVWRLSNAVSWFAQAKTVTADRRMELQQLSGELVAGKQKVSAKEV